MIIEKSFYIFSVKKNKWIPLEFNSPSTKIIYQAQKSH